ncbi:DoxX family protein [Asaia sp. VD9]|uniref:DoxX family protein n=1 Tax=Asaia sp. VD9 TaxID=3081235 RepID=UPI00301598E6
MHEAARYLFMVAMMGAGLVNLLGRDTLRAQFVRWGYPGWWCRVTGALEWVSVGLMTFPQMQMAGQVLAVMILLAVLITLLRWRAFSHMPAFGLFLALLALGWS